jgi:hypothetical protein
MRHVVSSAAILIAAAACGSEPSDASPCPQTSEFGNTGCAEVSGFVTDGDGHPLAGARVRVVGPAGPSRAVTLGSADEKTGPTGAYRLRVIRFDGQMPTGGPDTITVWVWAGVPSLLPPGGRDSATALLTLRPVGEVPVVTEVTLLRILGS